MDGYDILLRQDQPSASPPESRSRRAPTATPTPSHRPSRSLDRTAHPASTPTPSPDEPPRSADRPPARSRYRPPGRRTLGRVAFEFYLDQVEVLRQISLEQKLQGEKGSMSEMVP